MKKIFLLAFALLLVPVNANAHAGLVSANPEAGMEISAMPTQIALTFTEDLLTLGNQDVNTISLSDPSGAAIALTGIAANGALLTASIPAAEYASGSYTVDYKIVSADGHKLSDSYTFSLNAPTLYTAPPPANDGTGVLPLPIAGAIALVLVLGGFFALRARNRKR